VVSPPNPGLTPREAPATRQVWWGPRPAPWCAQTWFLKAPCKREGQQRGFGPIAPRATPGPWGEGLFPFCLGLRQNKGSRGRSGARVHVSGSWGGGGTNNATANQEVPQSPPRGFLGELFRQNIWGTKSKKLANNRESGEGTNASVSKLCVFPGKNHEPRSQKLRSFLDPCPAVGGIPHAINRTEKFPFFQVGGFLGSTLGSSV